MPSPLKILVVSAVVLSSACGAGNQSHIADDPGARSSLNTNRPLIHSTGGWYEVVQVFVTENMPVNVISAVENAVTSWNDAAGVDIVEFHGVSTQSRVQSSLYSTLDDKVTTIYFDDQNWAKNTGKPVTTLATTVWENDSKDTSLIVRADIILNAQHYLFIDGLDDAYAEVDDTSMVDAESVIVHEMGHLLGLDHVGIMRDRDSVMHAQTYIGYGVVNRYPSEGDAKLIQSVYGESTDL